MKKIIKDLIENRIGNGARNIKLNIPHEPSRPLSKILSAVGKCKHISHKKITNYFDSLREKTELPVINEFEQDAMQYQQQFAERIEKEQKTARILLLRDIKGMIQESMNNGKPIEHLMDIYLQRKNVLLLLALAREYDTGSYLYQDDLPADMYRIIINQSVCTDPISQIEECIAQHIGIPKSLFEYYNKWIFEQNHRTAVVTKWKWKKSDEIGLVMNDGRNIRIHPLSGNYTVVFPKGVMPDDFSIFSGYVHRICGSFVGRFVMDPASGEVKADDPELPLKFYIQDFIFEKSYIGTDPEKTKRGTTVLAKIVSNYFTISE